MLRPSERLFRLFLSRWWANWRRSLIIVQPATILRWRRRGLWAILYGQKNRNDSKTGELSRRAPQGRTVALWVVLRYP
jgi:hypothetical protein